MPWIQHSWSKMLTSHLSNKSELWNWSIIRPWTFFYRFHTVCECWQHLLFANSHLSTFEKQIKCSHSLSRFVYGFELSVCECLLFWQISVFDVDIFDPQIDRIAFGRHNSLLAYTGSFKICGIVAARDYARFTCDLLALLLIANAIFDLFVVKINFLKFKINQWVG